MGAKGGIAGGQSDIFVAEPERELYRRLRQMSAGSAPNDRAAAERELTILLEFLLAAG